MQTADSLLSAHAQLKILRSAGGFTFPHKILTDPITGIRICFGNNYFAHFPELEVPGHKEDMLVNVYKLEEPMPDWVTPDDDAPSISRALDGREEIVRQVFFATLFKLHFELRFGMGALHNWPEVQVPIFGYVYDHRHVFCPLRAEWRERSWENAFWLVDVDEPDMANPHPIRDMALIVSHA